MPVLVFGPQFVGLKGVGQRLWFIEGASGGPRTVVAGIAAEPFQLLNIVNQTFFTSSLRCLVPLGTMMPLNRSFFPRAIAAMLMRIFVYVMTHPDDPDRHGSWGCENCMGTKRSYCYDAVIGVGGVEAESYGFGHQLKWIGIGPHKTPVRWRGKPRHKVTFDHFCDFKTGSREIPKKLAAHIKKAPRGFMNLTMGELLEAQKLLSLAMNSPPSSVRAKRSANYEAVDGKDLCSP